MEVEIFDKNLTIGQPQMKVKGFHNLPLIQKPKIDLGRILGKNFSNRLVNTAHELAKSLTDINSKICKSKTYNKAVNNLIKRNRWQKAINEELQNLIPTKLGTISHYQTTKKLLDVNLYSE